jgi:hypothetical protein
MRHDVQQYGWDAFRPTPLFATTDATIMDNIEEAAIREERWHAQPGAPLYNCLAGDPSHDPRINIVIDASRRHRTAMDLRDYRVAMTTSTAQVEPQQQVPHIIDLTGNSGDSNPDIPGHSPRRVHTIVDVSTNQDEDMEFLG